MLYNFLIFTQLMAGIVCIIVAFYVGAKIASKYFEYKRIEFLLVGITGILITEPMWGIIVNLSLLLFDLGLPLGIINLIGFTGQPIGFFTWLFAISELMYKKKKKLFFIIAILYGVFFEIILYANPEFSIFFFNLMIVILISIALLIILITGLIFARENIISDDPEIQLKGKLLVYAFITYFIVLMITATIPLSSLFLTFFYLLLTTTSFAFYGGFVLPDWMKKLFLERNKILIKKKG